MEDGERWSDTMLMGEKRETGLVVYNNFMVVIDMNVKSNIKYSLRVC